MSGVIQNGQISNFSLPLFQRISLHYLSLSVQEKIPIEHQSWTHNLKEGTYGAQLIQNKKLVYVFDKRDFPSIVSKISMKSICVFKPLFCHHFSIRSRVTLESLQSSDVRLQRAQFSQSMTPLVQCGPCDEKLQCSSRNWRCAMRGS